MEKENKEKKERPGAGRRWYVVLAHQHREILAKTNLQNQGYHVYVPIMVREDKRGNSLTVPFFPGVLFIQIDVEAEHWRPILSTFGVRAFLMAGSSPSPVPDDAITRLQDQEINGLLQIIPDDGKPRDYNAQDKLKVLGFDLEGVFIEPVGARRVAMLINILGSARRVEVDRKRLKKAS